MKGKKERQKGRKKDKREEWKIQGKEGKKREEKKMRGKKER